MQDKKSNFLLGIYSKEPTIINNISFTPREIDVMACLLNARGTSKTAYFLKIAPKTVRRNIENLRLKLGCNSREGLIDFIEQSNKQHLLREHYSNLLTETEFNSSLKKISKITQSAGSCSLVFWEEHGATLYFLKTFKTFVGALKDHLELAGIKTVIEEIKTNASITHLEDQSKSEGFSIYIPGKSWKTIESSNSSAIKTMTDQIQNSLLIFIEKEEIEKTPKTWRGMDCLDFTESKNYYFSFFEILKKLLLPASLDGILEEFKKQYESIYDSSQVKSSQEKLEAEKKFLFVLEKRSFLTKKMAYLLIGLIAVVSSWSIWHTVIKRNPSEEQNSSYFTENPLETPISSDLVLPSDTTLLNRSELMAQIDAKFKKKGRGIQTVALVGIGGAGKTTVAREYARQQKANVVWEINAETKTTLADSFVNLAHALATTVEGKGILRGLTEIKNALEREKHIVEFVKTRLKLRSDWFLIYDNVENFADIQHFFPLNGETWGHGRIIITTRDSTIQNNRQVDHAVFIGELDKTQKLSLFTQIMKNGENFHLTPEKAKEAINFLEKIPPFPLDISVASYYLKTTNVPYSNYLEYLVKFDKDFTTVQQNLLKGAGEYTKTRYGIITLSLDQIMSVHKDFIDLLLFISLLDSQHIPRDFLTKYKNNSIIDNFIYHLKKYSLMTDDSSSSSIGSSFSVHRSTPHYPSLF